MRYGALRIKLRPGLATLAFISAENVVLDRTQVPCEQRKHRRRSR